MNHLLEVGTFSLSTARRLFLELLCVKHTKTKKRIVNVLIVEQTVWKTLGILLM